MRRDEAWRQDAAHLRKALIVKLVVPRAARLHPTDIRTPEIAGAAPDPGQHHRLLLCWQ